MHRRACAARDSYDSQEGLRSKGFLGFIGGPAQQGIHRIHRIQESLRSKGFERAQTSETRSGAALGGASSSVSSLGRKAGGVNGRLGCERKAGGVNGRLGVRTPRDSRRNLGRSRRCGAPWNAPATVGAAKIEVSAVASAVARARKMKLGLKK